MATTVNYRFKLRRKTLAQWNSDNDILLEGEMGVVLPDDTVVGDDFRWRTKVGDGTTPWLELDWSAGIGLIDWTGLEDGYVLAWDESATPPCWRPVEMSAGGADMPAVMARISLRI